MSERPERKQIRFSVKGSFEPKGDDSPDIRVHVIVVDGHDYIVAQGTDYADQPGMAMIHSAGCPTCEERRKRRRTQAE